MQTPATEPPGIRVVYYSDLPHTYLDDLYEELSELFPSVSIYPHEYGLQGAWEWALPAAVAIYIIGKPILDGFLQEIGAGGARALKTKLTRVFNRVKQKNIRWVSLREAEARLQVERNERLKHESRRVPVSGRHASILSVWVELGDTGSSAKFVFSGELDESKFLKALETLDSAIAAAASTEQARLQKARETLRSAIAAASSAKEARLQMAKHYLLVRPMNLIYIYHVDRSEWLRVWPREK